MNEPVLTITEKETEMGQRVIKEFTCDLCEWTILEDNIHIDTPEGWLVVPGGSEKDRWLCGKCKKGVRHALANDDAAPVQGAPPTNAHIGEMLREIGAVEWDAFRKDCSSHAPRNDPSETHRCANERNQDDHSYTRCIRDICPRKDEIPGPTSAPDKEGE